MVLIECIIMNKCRLCQNNPGQYNINNDKNLLTEIYECTKIKVNDTTMSLLPQCICEECKNTIKNFFHYKQRIHKVDQTLRKMLLNINSKCKSSENTCVEDVFKCSECPTVFHIQNNIKSHSRQDLIKDSHKTYSEKKIDTLHCNEKCNFLKVSESYKCQKFERDTSLSNNSNNVNEDLQLIISKENHSTEFKNENKPFILNKVDDNKGEIICDICNQKFDNRDQLKIHKKCHKTKYVCSWKNCKKVLNSAYTLKTHELKHAGKRSFLCVTCGKGFITKNSLTCHEKIHLDVKGYICKSCNIGFSVRSNLRAHEKKHHEGIRFYCSQCTKAFVSKCSLERHERIHTGIKEFQCQSCPSAFYTNKELVKHQRYHQGLRLHKCNECFKTFFERHHLVIHLRSHTGERPYICKVPNCGKSFMESQKLKRHHKAKHA